MNLIMQKFKIGDVVGSVFSRDIEIIDIRIALEEDIQTYVLGGREFRMDNWVGQHCYVLKGKIHNSLIPTNVVDREFYLSKSQ